MLIVNETKHFIEKETAPIVIFGTGNAAYWTGYYLNKCGINFLCYVDDSVGNDIAYCNGRPVVNWRNFMVKMNLDATGKGGGEKQFRLIVPDKNFEQDLALINAVEQKFELKIMCLIPVYKTSEKVITYNINKMLGYFRLKSMKPEYPTIITNECAAGRIYEQLGMFYASPLINTNLSYEDYIKFCYDPKKYFVPITGKMYRKHWYRSPAATDFGFVPTAMIEDIEISFPHDNNFETAKERWNFLVGHVNFNRLIYVLVNSNGAIPFKIMKDFAALQGEKLLFYYGEMFSFPVANDIIFANREKFVASGEAIENYFDLVGWINREYKLGGILNGYQFEKRSES